MVITGEQLRAVQAALVHFEKVLKSRKESGDKVLQRSSTLSAWEIEIVDLGEWVGVELCPTAEASRFASISYRIRRADGVFDPEPPPVRRE